MLRSATLIPKEMFALKLYVFGYSDDVGGKVGEGRKRCFI